MEYSQFRLESLPNQLQISILNSVRLQDSLKFLQVSQKLRHFALTNGVFRGKIEKISIEFEEGRPLRFLISLDSFEIRSDHWPNSMFALYSPILTCREFEIKIHYHYFRKDDESRFIACFEAVTDAFRVLRSVKKLSIQTHSVAVLEKLNLSSRLPSASDEFALYLLDFVEKEPAFLQRVFESQKQAKVRKIVGFLGSVDDFLSNHHANVIQLGSFTENDYFWAIRHCLSQGLPNHGTLGLFAQETARLELDVLEELAERGFTEIPPEDCPVHGFEELEKQKTRPIRAFRREKHDHLPVTHCRIIAYRENPKKTTSNCLLFTIQEARTRPSTEYFYSS